MFLNNVSFKTHNFSDYDTRPTPCIIYCSIALYHIITLWFFVLFEIIKYNELGIVCRTRLTICKKVFMTFAHSDYYSNNYLCLIYIHWYSVNVRSPISDWKNNILYLYTAVVLQHTDRVKCEKCSIHLGHRSRAHKHHAATSIYNNKIYIYMYCFTGKTEFLQKKNTIFSTLIYKW